MLPAMALRPLLASHFATQASIFAGLASHLQQAAIPVAASAALVVATIMPGQMHEPSVGISSALPLPVERVATRPLIASNHGQSPSATERGPIAFSQAFSLDRFGQPTGGGTVPSPVAEPMTVPPLSPEVPQPLETSLQASHGPEAHSTPTSVDSALSPTQPGGSTEALSSGAIPPLPEVLNVVVGWPSVLSVPLVAPLNLPLNLTQPSAVLARPPVSLPSSMMPSVSVPNLPLLGVPSVSTSVPQSPAIIPQQSVPSVPPVRLSNIPVVSQLNVAIPQLQPAPSRVVPLPVQGEKLK